MGKTLEEANATFVLLQNVKFSKHEARAEKELAFTLAKKELLEAVSEITKTHFSLAKFFMNKSTKIYTSQEIPNNQLIIQWINKNENFKDKEKAYELAEKEAVEAENNVQTIKLEIEAIKVKGQFEETFLRFPHIAEQIFETLDVQSLSKCQKVGKCWQNFIFETKPFFRLLENYTSIPKLMLKKSLKDYDFQTIQKMAICASISHKKAVNATKPFEKTPLAESKGPTLLYYILSQGNLNDTQLLLVKLMILNKMNNAMTSFDEQDLIDCENSLTELVKDTRKGNFGKGYTSFKHSVMMKKGMWEIIWSGKTILLVAVAQNHLVVCKLVFDQIQDIHLLYQLGKNVLFLATQFGFKDICEFILEKVQGFDLLDVKNQHGESIIQMAERLGKTEICALFESFMQKQK